MTHSHSTTRCHWVDETKPDYVAYHDNEWGKPVYDDRVFFEFLILESAQAGLSWYTILVKREAYRRAFAQFDPLVVAAFTEDDFNRLMEDKGIVRNKLKIRAAIKNANVFLAIQAEFGSFSDYVWRFVDNKPIVNRFENLADYPTTSAESDALSKDLKKRGMSFVGSTTCYSFMQAMGLVDDHQPHCEYKSKG